VSIFDYFITRKKNTASLAKERLQVIIAHERGRRKLPNYMPQMQQEIIDVIKKYISIDEDQVSIKLDSNDNHSILELNVTLPEGSN
jgi:cell division topological specificity factor